MLNKRKAQGLSITTIIVAVIALIVLVVIVAILTGRMGSFSAGVGEAASCDNMCKSFGKVKGGSAGLINIGEDNEEYSCLTGEQHISGKYENEVQEMCCCKKAP